MEREVNQIWAPYGVTLEGLVAPCKTPGEGPMLKVRVRKIENVRPAGIPRGTLGNIYFVAGKPTPVIDLWADEAVRVMGGSSVMLTQGLGDPRVRIEMGRLLGRSLAHELGHYLLGSSVHTEQGLMRRIVRSAGRQDQDARQFFARRESGRGGGADGFDLARRRRAPAPGDGRGGRQDHAPAHGDVTARGSRGCWRRSFRMRRCRVIRIRRCRRQTRSRR